MLSEHNINYAELGGKVNSLFFYLLSSSILKGIFVISNSPNNKNQGGAVVSAEALKLEGFGFFDFLQQSRNVLVRLIGGEHLYPIFYINCD